MLESNNYSSLDILGASPDAGIGNKHRLDIEISAMLFATDLFFLILNFYFHYLIYRMVFRKDRKNSQVIIQNLLACYSVIVPITFFVVFLYLNIVLQYIHRPSEALGEWFCFAYEYFAHATGIYLGAFSLFTAAMKYWFIVDNARSKSFGEEKGRTIFLTLHLMIPVIIAALNSISNGQKDHIYVVNICWSQPISNIDNINRNASADYEPMDMLCSSRHYQTRYYLGETTSYYLDPVLRLICGSINIFYFLFCSNMCELLLYALVYRYLNR